MLALLALTLQLFVAQPHLNAHALRGLSAEPAHAAAVVTGETAAEAHALLGLAACSVCQAALTGRAPLALAATFGPPVFSAVANAATLLAPPPFARAVSHTWRSRAPPVRI